METQTAWLGPLRKAVEGWMERILEKDRSEDVRFVGLVWLLMGRMRRRC
jgi:hypothetical protein